MRAQGATVETKQSKDIYGIIAIHISVECSLINSRRRVMPSRDWSNVSCIRVAPARLRL
jgi:hypothetical protein